MKIDFNVNISKMTRGVTQRGFGTILILDTEGTQPYSLYYNIEDLSEDYGPETETYSIASRILGQNPAPQQVAVMGAVDISLNLNTAAEEDFFFVVATDSEVATIEEISEWVSTKDKMYFVTTSDLEVPAQIENENVVVMYHDDPTAHVAEGLASYLATATIGGVTAKFKTINGVRAAKVTATELEQLHKDNAFTYIRKMGVLQTSEGTATNGEFIDVVMGAFFIKFRLEEEAMLLAVNNAKIPYTNEGIGMLVSITEDVLKIATNQQIILNNEGVGDYTIRYLSREEVSKNDIANRVYNGIEWTATLAGAIHGGTITGQLVL